MQDDQQGQGPAPQTTGSPSGSPPAGSEPKRQSQSSQAPSQSRPPDDQSSGGGSAAAQAGASPQQVLDQLTKDLQQADANAKQYGQHSEALKTDIAELQRTNQDVETTATAYGKARPSLEQQRDDLAASISANRRENIDRAVGDMKDDIDRAVQELDTDAKTLQDTQDKQWKDVIELAQTRLSNERYLTRAQADFEEEKARQTAINKRLTRLTELQKELDAAEDAGDGVRMYAVLKEYDRQLDTITQQLETVDDYRKDLEEAWGGVSDARATLRTTMQQESEKQYELQQSKDELARLESNRIAEVLKRAGSTGSGTSAS